MKYNILLFVSLLGIFSSCGGDDDTPMEQAQVVSTTIVDITNITDFDAQVNVTIENASAIVITERGVVYGLQNNPTVGDVKITNSGSQATFSLTINDLASATRYFVRSYFIEEGDVSYSGSSEFVTTDLCAQNVFIGNVRLETQSELEAFGALGYCKIDGSLQIGASFNDDELIADISSLSTIQEVKSLGIYNTLLINLDPLINLRKASYIVLQSNDNLENIDGLINIASGVSGIRVLSNPKIQNINGLSNLSSVEFSIDTIIIYNNPLLQNIDGLLGFQKWTDGTIAISENPLLTNINGLVNLRDISYTSIRIYNNIRLENIDALSAIVNTEYSSFYIVNNPMLQNIDGLSNLSSPLFTLNISGVPNLVNLDVLSGIPIIYSLNISNNISLTSIEGISNIEIGGLNEGVSISNNNSLLSLNGLEITGGSLGSLDIKNNPSLIDLNGLQSLFNCDRLVIRGNDNLLNLEGLENISSLYITLNVGLNMSLTDFCSLNNLIQNNGLQGSYYVQNNAYKPTQQDIIDGDCSF